MMNRRTFILSSCAGLLAFHRVEAQPVSLSDEAIGAILRRRIDVEKRATGMAVGIAEAGRRRAIVYWQTGLGRRATRRRRHAVRNRFDHEGLSPALLLADMVHRQELQLDDPVDRHLPSGFGTPQRNGRAITLGDLATHTSGLPLFPPVTGNPLEPLARYTTSDLRSWLAAVTLSRDPGTQWEYSNVGYGLLGLALANRAGTTYDGLLDRRIISPLRLTDTTLNPTGEATRRLAVGHDPRLAPMPPLDLGIFAPAGGLRSTVENLLDFISAVLPDSGSPLEVPARLLLSVRRPAPAIGGDQALGWDVMTGPDPFVAKDVRCADASIRRPGATPDPPGVAARLALRRLECI
jgi:CubicO group peptidase (beta-lactamase class C family)